MWSNNRTLSLFHLLRSSSLSVFAHMPSSCPNGIRASGQNEVENASCSLSSSSPPTPSQPLVATTAPLSATTTTTLATTKSALVNHKNTHETKQNTGKGGYTLPNLIVWMKLKFLNWTFVLFLFMWPQIHVGLKDLAGRTRPEGKYLHRTVAESLLIHLTCIPYKI